MNWCHLDDAGGVVRAALERGRVGSVYHGSDALPARRWDVVRWIAERLGVEPVRRDGATDEAADRPRRSNRRISGERTRSELGVELRYPSFRDGLAPLIT